MSTELHGRRATRLTGAEREGSFTQTESVARGGRERGGQRARLREPRLFVFFTGARIFQPGGK